ncbi:g4036 [Coccomyxa elongata]
MGTANKLNHFLRQNASPRLTLFWDPLLAPAHRQLSNVVTQLLETYQGDCSLDRLSSIQISRQILTGSGDGCIGTAKPLTAQSILTHLADTPEPHSPNMLCTDENKTQPAPPPAPAPPSSPPPPETRTAVPAPVVEAPEAAAIPVYQDKGFLVVKAVLPLERDGRVRVAYNNLVYAVTGTMPPHHSETGQRGLHQQKDGLIDS